MNEMTTITLGLALVAIALLFSLLWQQKRKRQALHRLAQRLLWEGAPHTLLDGSAEDVTRALLTALNCTWEERSEGDDEKYLGFAFDYQGGHFALILNRASKTLTLYFQNLFSLPIAELNEMRAVTNWHNEQSFMLRATYDVRPATNEVCLSLRSHFFITHDVSRLLSSVRSALHFCFEARRDINAWYDSIKADGNEIDPERSNLEWERELYLLHEQELMHQHTEFAQRQNDDERLALSTFMAQGAGINVNSYVALQIVTERTQLIESELDIASFDLASALIGKKPDGTHYLKRLMAVLRLSYTTLDAPEHERTATLLLEAEGQATHGSYYFRTTLSLPPTQLRAERPRLGEDHHGKQVSALMAYDTETPEQKIQEAKYMWHDALDKAREGRADQLSQAQRMVINSTIPHVSMHMYWGTTYFYQARYYEALPRFEQVYELLKRDLNSLSKGDRHIFYEACYLAGFCHSSLKQYKQAYFYLDAIFGKGPKYTQEYVNCLTNAKDFRALLLIDRLLQELPPNTDEDEGNEMIDSLRSFLFRRRAYALIDVGRYKEAHDLLTQMLDDPNNSEFAHSELAYLNDLARHDARVLDALRGQTKPDKDNTPLDKWSDDTTPQ